MKLRGLSVYSAPASVGGHAMPTSVADIGLRHRGGLGSNLRASVFGVSDGLVSNASLVLGVAGAGAAGGYVLLTGAAGMLAGLIYQARGVDIDQARKVSRTLLANPEQALDVLSREELGLNPDDLGSPFGAALTSFLSFALGAALPLVPFVAMKNTGAVTLEITAALTCGALFLIGLVLSLFTGRDALKGALRMVLIGAGAGVVSFVVGRLLGVAIGG